MAGPVKTVAIGCGSALLLLVLVVAALIMVTRRPDGVEVRIEAPLEAVVGERFTFVARVKNTSSEARTLADLDVADSYLRGIVIERTEPAFSEASHMPIDNTMSYTLNQSIAAGAELVVTVFAMAGHPGDHAGDVDFCIDSRMSCLPYPIRTIVRKP